MKFSKVKKRPSGAIRHTDPYFIVELTAPYKITEVHELEQEGEKRYFVTITNQEISFVVNFFGDPEILKNDQYDKIVLKITWEKRYKQIKSASPYQWSIQINKLI